TRRRPRPLASTAAGMSTRAGATPRFPCHRKFSPWRSAHWSHTEKATGRQTVGEHDRVYGAGARSGNAFEFEPAFLEQPIEHAPREGAMAAAALQRQIDDFSGPRPIPQRVRIRRDFARWSWQQ